MKGTRPLNNNEIRLVSACFDGTFEARNRGLFMLGVSTGGRISELLSLQIADVYQNDRPVTDLHAIVQKSDLPNFRESATLNKSSLGWHCYETVTQHHSLPPSGPGSYAPWHTKDRL